MIKGMDKLLRRLDEIEGKMPSMKKVFMEEQGQKLKDNAKLLTPVDTGALRNEFRYKVTSNDSVAVYNNTSYANHVEWGTRHKQGAHMLKRALNTTNEDMHNDLKRFLGKVIE